MSGDRSPPTILPAYRAPSGIGPKRFDYQDVPGMPDVYYSTDMDNFYSRSERRGMGDAFYRANIHLMGRAAINVR